MTTIVKRNNTSFPVLVNDLFDTDFFNFDNDFLKLQSKLIPAVNVTETDKEYKIEMAAPGLEKKDFKVAVEKGILTVSSEKQTEQTEEKRTTGEKNFRTTNSVALSNYLIIPLPKKLTLSMKMVFLLWPFLKKKLLWQTLRKKSKFPKWDYLLKGTCL